MSVSLLGIPAVANGNYELVAQVTDSKGDVSNAIGSSYTLAIPFLSLVPSDATETIARSGTGVIRFILSNAGNVKSTGTSTVAVLAAAIPVYSVPMKLMILPAKARVVRLRLSAAEMNLLQAAAVMTLQVTDPLGGIETLELTGLNK